MSRRVISTAAISALLIGSVSAQVIESTLEPKAPVYLELTSVEAFQKSFNATDPVANASANTIVIDDEAGVAVQAVQGRLNLTNRHVTPDGRIQYIVSLIDEDSGAPLQIQSGDFAITDTNNNPVDFEVETFAEAKFPASVILLIDASGSMGGVMDHVLAQANTLFDRAPDHLHCEAIVFATNSKRYGDPDAPCTAQEVNLSGVKAGGNTRLFTALKNAFKSMNTRNSHHQKMVLVLTDGAPTDGDATLFDEVVKLKSGTQVLFFWLGRKSPDAEKLFEPLADHYVDDPNGAWRYLDQYFGVFTNKLASQTVITIDPTNSSPAGQP